MSKKKLNKFIVGTLVLMVASGLYLLLYSPKIEDLTVTNVTSNSFSVVWTTNRPTVGSLVLSDTNDFPKFIGDTNERVYHDDRDLEEVDLTVYKLIDSPEKRYTHHVTVRGIDSEKYYNFAVRNGGRIYVPEVNSISTLPIAATIQTPDPVYGLIASEDDTPSFDGYVILTRVSGEGDEERVSQSVSTFISEEGSYSLDINGLWDSNFENMFETSDTDIELLEFYLGGSGIVRDTFEASPLEDQPVPSLVYMDNIDNLSLSKFSLIVSAAGGVTTEKEFNDFCKKFPRECSGREDNEDKPVKQESLSAVKARAAKVAKQAAANRAAKKAAAATPTGKSCGDGYYSCLQRGRPSCCEKEVNTDCYRLTGAMREACLSGELDTDNIKDCPPRKSCTSGVLTAYYYTRVNGSCVKKTYACPQSDADDGEVNADCYRLTGDMRQACLDGDLDTDNLTSCSHKEKTVCIPGQITGSFWKLRNGSCVQQSYACPNSKPDDFICEAGAGDFIGSTSGDRLYSSMKDAPFYLQSVSAQVTECDNGCIEETPCDDFSCMDELPECSTAESGGGDICSTFCQNFDTDSGPSVPSCRVSEYDWEYNDTANNWEAHPTCRCTLSSTAQLYAMTKWTGWGPCNSNGWQINRAIGMDINGNDKIDKNSGEDSYNFLTQERECLSGTGGGGGNTSGGGGGNTSGGSGGGTETGGGGGGVGGYSDNDSLIPVTLSQYADNCLRASDVKTTCYVDNGKLITSRYENMCIQTDKGSYKATSRMCGPAQACSIDSGTCERLPVNKAVTCTVCKKSVNGKTSFVGCQGAKVDTNGVQKIWTINGNEVLYSGDGKYSICIGDSKNQPQLVSGIICHDTSGNVTDCAKVVNYFKNPEDIARSGETESVIAISDNTLIRVLGIGTDVKSSSNTGEMVGQGAYLITGENLDNQTVHIDNAGSLNMFFDLNGNGTKDLNEDFLYGNDIEQMGLEVEKVADALSYNLIIGWNSIAVPYYIGSELGSNIKTSYELLEHINASGVEVTHLTAYRGGRFVVSSIRLADDGSFVRYGEEYNIVMGEGYFVRAYNAGPFKLYGSKIPSGLPTTIAPGWNLVAFSEGTRGDYGGFEILDWMQGQGIESEILSKWEGGMYTNLVSKNGVEYGNDYKVYEDIGYWVQSKGSNIKTFYPRMTAK